MHFRPIPHSLNELTIVNILYHLRHEAINPIKDRTASITPNTMQYIAIVSKGNQSVPFTPYWNERGKWRHSCRIQFTTYQQFLV